MKPGPLFRLLRLRRVLCPSCHRDNIWRTRNDPPLFCRWCEASMVDWAALVSAIRRMAAAFSTSFEACARAVTSVMNAYASPLPDLTGQFPYNPLDSAVRMRRLVGDPLPQPPQEDPDGHPNA